jgi:hypothetical protein
MDTNKPNDPILSPKMMCDEANISLDTWRRVYRNKLPIIKLSPKRIGARQSAWRKALEQNTEGRAD